MSSSNLLSDSMPVLKTSAPSLIGDLMPSIKSIVVGLVLNTFDLIAFVPISIDAIFILYHHYIW